MLSNIKDPKLLTLLNINKAQRSMRLMMYKLLLPNFLVLSLGLSGPAIAANCYADYKAKKDNPLRLHYGVVELRGACKKGPAQSEIASRLSRQGWTLLNVMSVFGPEGLKQRKGNAGRFYLRF